MAKRGDSEQSAGGGRKLENHWRGCFGCGPDNPCSLGLVMYGADERVWGELTIDERHQGAPGFAHGGVIAAALDDAFGMLLRLQNRAAVTVHIELDYRRPWLIGARHRIEAWSTGSEGRKLYMRADARDEAGNVVADATTIYLEVGREHFAEGVERAREQAGIAEVPGQIELPW